MEEVDEGFDGKKKIKGNDDKDFWKERKTLHIVICFTVKLRFIFHGLMKTGTNISMWRIIV